MAVYNIAAGAIAVHNKTLAANVVDAVNFEIDPSAIEIETNGTAAIYITTDGSTPTVGGANTRIIPATPCRRLIRHGGDRAVRLISAGTPTYSITTAAIEDVIRGNTLIAERVDSLESGDAWTGAASGRVLTSGTPPTWEAAGGGGGADLGAVDQDVNVLNSHVVDFQGDIGSDAAAQTSIAWRDDNYGLCVVGPDPDATTTDLYVQRPGERQQYVNISTYYGGHRPSVQFRMLDGAGPSTFNARLYIVGEATIETDDVRHTASHGPILQAPDASLHRLIVANDGTLSTEPVV